MGDRGPHVPELACGEPEDPERHRRRRIVAVPLRTLESHRGQLAGAMGVDLDEAKCLGHVGGLLVTHVGFLQTGGSVGETGRKNHSAAYHGPGIRAQPC